MNGGCLFLFCSKENWGERLTGFLDFLELSIYGFELNSWAILNPVCVSFTPTPPSSPLSPQLELLDPRWGFPWNFGKVFAYIQMEPKFGVAPLWFVWARLGTHLDLFLKLVLVLTKDRVKVVPRRT